MQMTLPTLLPHGSLLEAAQGRVPPWLCSPFSCFCDSQLLSIQALFGNTEPIPKLWGAWGDSS